MCRTALCCMTFCIAMAGAVGAEESARGGDKRLGGMSIVGNDDAPKSLVIVPWKSSSLGDTLELSKILGAGRGPVYRDVFLRELHYYEIRVGSSSEHGPDPQ